MKLSYLAKKIAGEFRGTDTDFNAVSTDTRTLQQGSVFVALIGENFDAHNFLAQAKLGGAVAVVVSRWVDFDIPQIKVADTRQALGAWAACIRDQFKPKVVAVTGSCGKTSVKEMITAILSQQGKVLSTQGNLNNDIGVPLTLLRVDASYDYAVIELGANHLGEIEYTVGLVKPDVAMITNVGDAHLEGFGSRKNISKAKSEIYNGLSSQGVAVINLDDDFSQEWLTLNNSRQCRTFSLSNSQADVFAKQWTVDAAGKPTITVSIDRSLTEITLNVLGEHQILNALGAIAAATAMGATTESIAKGLQSLAPYKGRMFPRVLGHWRWIEDSYNANPTSMRAAIDALSKLSEPRALILGRMGELGEAAAELHAEVAEYAAKAGIRLLLTVGDSEEDYLRGFRRVTPEGEVLSLPDHSAVAAKLVEKFPSGTVLVKGSRSAAMEKVFDEAASRLAQGVTN